MTWYSVHLNNVTNTLYMYNHPHSHGSSLVFSHNTFNLQLVTTQVAHTDIRYIYVELRLVQDMRPTGNATVLWPESSDICYNTKRYDSSKCGIKLWEMYWENLNLYCRTITQATNGSIILDTAHCCIFLKHDVSENPSVCEESSLPGCNTRLNDAQFQCLHVRVKPTKKKLPDPENEGIITLQNTRNHLPNNTVSHSQRLESAATLWQLKISPGSVSIIR